MIASVRPLLPKGWSTQHEVAWSWLLESVERTVVTNMPFMMLIFTLLGFTAGVKTMMRSAKEIQGATTGASAAQDDKRT